MYLSREGDQLSPLFNCNYLTPLVIYGNLSILLMTFTFALLGDAYSSY